MASKVSSRLTFRRKDGKSKGIISKGVSVSGDAASARIRSYVRKRRYR